ncbi:MAG: hypothetical protein IPK03_07510 [Bacteroidetes bacterium]|nr:hypothetical protein [Bacteroidota bacterium]
MTKYRQVYKQLKLSKSVFWMFLIAWIFAIKSAKSQEETTPVDILNADLLNILQINGKEVKKLIGNVKLKNKDAIMYCDSAIVDADNNIDAAGHIVILKGDSVRLSGNFLIYPAATKIANVRGNVKLTDLKMILNTTELWYEMNGDVGYYNNGGVVTSKDTKIKSTYGTYYKRTRDVFFKDKVKVTNPKYKLNSDTLKYNLDNEFVTFYGATEIFNDSSTIWCNTGWYDSKKNIASFGANTFIISGAQWLRTDSLYYLRDIGYGKVMKRYDFHDTSLHIIMEGDYADYYDKSNHVIGRNRPLLTHEQDKDNILFMRAEILETMEEGGSKTFFGYKKVRMYKKDFQAVCDTFVYSYRDSTFKLYRDPLLWNDSSQLKADTIFLYTKNKQPNKASLFTKAFVSEHLEQNLFNQMKGNIIHIYFKNKKTDYMEAYPEAENKYFGREDGKGYEGLNSAKSDKIIAYFLEGKVNRIQFVGKPEAVFTPMKKVGKDMLFLMDFKWQGSLRPISKEDL